MASHLLYEAPSSRYSGPALKRRRALPVPSALRYSAQCEWAIQFLTVNYGQPPERVDEHTLRCPATETLPELYLMTFDRREANDADRTAFAARYEALARAASDDAFILVLRPSGANSTNKFPGIDERPKHKQLTIFQFFDQFTHARSRSQRQRRAKLANPSQPCGLPIIEASATLGPAQAPSSAYDSATRTQAVKLLHEVKSSFPTYDSTLRDVDLRPNQAGLIVIRGPAGFGKSTFFDVLFERLNAPFDRKSPGGTLAQKQTILGCRPIKITDVIELRAEAHRTGDLVTAIHVLYFNGKILSVGGLKFLLHHGFLAMFFDAVDEIRDADEAFVGEMVRWTSTPGSRANIFLFTRDSLFAAPLATMSALLPKAGVKLPEHVRIATLAPWSRGDILKIAEAVFESPPDVPSVLRRILQSAETWLRGAPSAADERPSGSDQEISHAIARRRAREHLDVWLRDPHLKSLLTHPWMCVALLTHFAKHRTIDPLVETDELLMAGLRTICLELTERERDKAGFDFSVLLNAEQCASIAEIRARCDVFGQLTSAHRKHLTKAARDIVHALMVQNFAITRQSEGAMNDALSNETAEVWNLTAFFEDLAYEMKKKNQAPGLHPITLEDFDRVFTSRYRATGDSAPRDASRYHAQTGELEPCWREFVACATRASLLPDDVLDDVRHGLLKAAFLTSSADGSQLCFVSEAIQDYLAGRHVARVINQSTGRDQLPPQGTLTWIACFDNPNSVLMRAIAYELDDLRAACDQLQRLIEVDEQLFNYVEGNATIPTRKDRAGAIRLHTVLKARLGDV